MEQEHQLYIIRKICQELGVRTNEFDIAKLKFLTRIHYCSGDRAGTSAADWCWGEHEIDYILLMQDNIICSPNPDEIAELKYVSYQELKEMMNPSSGITFSPWFRLISERFLPLWWENLDRTLCTDDFVDLHVIHRLN